MGNHASKASKTLFHDILSQFSEEEKAILMKEFEEFTSDNDLHNERNGKQHGIRVTALSIKVNWQLNSFITIIFCLLEYCSI